MKIFAVILSLIAPTVLIGQTEVLTYADNVPASQRGGTTSSTTQDPLGRATPRGTILGFTRAAQSGDYKQAMQYLQLSPSQRKENGEELAKDLKVVLDQGFVGSVLRLSDRPEGTLQADLPANRERAGRLVAGRLEADLMLNRVPGDNGDIWLISHDTLEQVPDLYSETRTQQFEAELPAPLVNHSFLGIALWQWLAIFILAPLCWLVAWLLSHLAMRLRKGKKVSPSGIATRAGPDLVLPSSLLLACVLNVIAVRQLHLPLLSRFYYFRLLWLTILVSVTWLVWRLIVRAAEAWQSRAIAKGQVSTGTLLILGRRVAKVCLVILLLLAVFKALGFDMTAAVAGLGIGGIAIAFGAQKTLENLLGGISLLSDEVIRVGDVCRIGNNVGTVEDISLRSTRMRTPERSELSIPNGSLASMTIENLSRRDKMLINSVLGIRQDIEPEQLHQLLTEIRTMLMQHPSIESQTVRVRWTEISDSAFNIEVFCYAKTVSGPEFFEIREDCLMKILEIVYSVGAALAYPSRTLYVGSMDREAGKLALQAKLAPTADAQEPTATSALRRRAAT